MAAGVCVWGWPNVNEALPSWLGVGALLILEAGEGRKDSFELGAARLGKGLLLLLGVCACVPELGKVNVGGREFVALFPKLEPVPGAPNMDLEAIIGAAGWLPNILLVLVVCGFGVVEKPPNIFFPASSSPPSALLFSVPLIAVELWLICENPANGLLTPAGCPPPKSNAPVPGTLNDSEVCIL